MWNVGKADIFHDRGKKVRAAGTGVHERGHPIKACEGQPGKNRRCFTETVLFSQTAGRQGGKRWGNAVGSRKRAAGRKSH